MTISSQFRRGGDTLLVNLSGSMTFRDYAGADELLTAIFAELSEGAMPFKTVVFELASVSMIDSHWLGMFVRALRRAETLGVGIVLRGAQPAVRRLFDLVQFDRVFRIEK